MTKILIAGLDGSLRNFGISKMSLDLISGQLDIVDLLLIQTEKSKHKTVRSSSDNLIRAQSIAKGAHKFLDGVTTLFGEVPSGGQDYKSVLGFGIVIGVYASLRQPFLEVAPSETKKAAVGTRTASKQEMIEWAFETYPKAPWLTTKRQGQIVPVLKNEHLADATAVVHAGILTPAFQQVRAILSAGVGKAA